MRAVVKARPGRGQLELVEREAEPPGWDEVTIAVAAAGVCGTDLEVHLWPAWLAERMGPHLPIVMGHEFSGVVESVGGGVGNVSVGDLVSVESHVACGTCRNCSTGRSHICQTLTYVGIEHDGGFADTATVRAGLVRPVSSAVPAEVAAMLEPFGLAVRAASGVGEDSGLTVLITGCGPIGLMSAACARAMGAETIIVAERQIARVEAARSLASVIGIDMVVDTSGEDLVETSRSLTDGRGVDLWVDFTGNEEALRLGIDATAPGGEARLLGTSFGPVPFELSRAIMKEVRISTIHGRLLDETWTQAIELVSSGKVDLLPLISARVDLEDFADVFESLVRGEVLKVLFVPGGTGGRY